jgi:DNA-binding MarR family transcriptional regulator
MDDFSRCMVSNTRMAARAITRRYDAYTRPFGITSTQYSVLGLIVASSERNVSELAERRGFERTTLTRNLDRLEKMGLIASRPAEHGNGRICSLTPKGRALVDELLPLWRKAQAEIRQELGADGFEDTLMKLQRLATI